jgi:hypothetical protein
MSSVLDHIPDPVGRQALPPQKTELPKPQFETGRDPGDEDDPDDGKGSN